jgi:hypothetical protein
MVKTIAASAVAVLALVLAGAATAIPQPGLIPPDEGGTNLCPNPTWYGNEYLDGYCFEEALPDSDSTYDAYNKVSCKTVGYSRVFKSWTGFRVWRYVEKVRFCYNGTKVTQTLWRTRYPEWLKAGASFYWDFDGHIGNSCSTEGCSDQHGNFTAYYWTQGKFKACITGPLGLLCNTRLPWVGITVWALGTKQYSSGG